MPFEVETLDQLIPWMKQSSLPQLSGWVAGTLREDPRYYPMQLRRGTPEEVLLIVYRYSNDVEFQCKMKEALGIVSHSVSWRHEDPDFLSNLLAAIGYLNVRPVYDLLIRLALKQTLLHRWLRPGVSLHRFVLASLAGLGCDSRSIHIFVRDIHTPEFAGTCFRAIWPFDPDIGVGVSDVLVQIGAGDPHFPTPLLLKEMVSRLSLDMGWRLLHSVLTSARLNHEQKLYFARLARLGRLGFGLNQSTDSFELTRLGAVDERLRAPRGEVKSDIQRLLLDSWAEQFPTISADKPPPEIMTSLIPVFQHVPRETLLANPGQALS